MNYRGLARQTFWAHTATFYPDPQSHEQIEVRRASSAVTFSWSQPTTALLPVSSIILDLPPRGKNDLTNRARAVSIGDMAILKDKLKRYRLETTKALEEALGVVEAEASRWLNGSSFSVNTAKRISAIIGMSWQEIYEWQNHKRRKGA